MNLVKFVCVLLGVLLALGLAGCGKGRIKASAIQAPLKAVTSRHDAYVKADSNLAPVERETALRSSELVNKAVDEALGKKSEPEATKGEEVKDGAVKRTLTNAENGAITYGPAD